MYQEEEFWAELRMALARSVSVHDLFSMVEELEEGIWPTANGPIQVSKTIH